MLRIETILCPVEAPHASLRSVGLATRLAKSFGSRLVLLHDVGVEAPEFQPNFRVDSRDIVPMRRMDPSIAERTLRQIISELDPSIHAEAWVTSGRRADSILQLARQLPAQLIIMATNGPHGDRHDSLTERILEEAPCPVLATHLAPGEDRLDPFATGDVERMNAIVPIDFSEHSLGVLDHAFTLADRFDLELHFVEIEEELRWGDVLQFTDRSPAENRKRRLEEGLWRLQALVPPELYWRVNCSVETGPAAAGIVEAARRLDAALILMGIHPKGAFERMLTGATSVKVLRKASCPILFVPPSLVAARVTEQAPSLSAPAPSIG